MDNNERMENNKGMQLPSEMSNIPSEEGTKGTGMLFVGLEVGGTNLKAGVLDGDSGQLLGDFQQERLSKGSSGCEPEVCLKCITFVVPPGCSCDARTQLPATMHLCTWLFRRFQPRHVVNDDIKFQSSRCFAIEGNKPDQRGACVRTANRVSSFGAITESQNSTIISVGTLELYSTRDRRGSTPRTRVTCP